MATDAGTIAIAIAVVAVAPAVAFGYRWPARAPSIAAMSATALAAALAVAWACGTHVLADTPWLTLARSRLRLELDGLGAPLAVFSAAVAAPILFYTRGYLPHHLAQQGRPERDNARFCALMLAFALAMTLLVLAQDLLVLFVALELTALVSYLLIQFDRHRKKARQAASLALVVTVGSSLLFLAGALLLARECGTTVLSELQTCLDGASSTTASRTAVAVLLTLGLIGKSAQVPLHVWLPRAMVAPTPVSAYLHSASMVAAGAFVLLRLRFILAGAPAVLTGLVWLGFASIVVGSLLALVSDRLKRILAYSTVAQYGHVMVLIGLGGDHGVAGAPLFIVSHGLAKCALFLTAGAVATVTGARRLSEVGHLARSMPVVAAGSAIAAAGLAGLPLTAGYPKDEVLLAAAASHGVAVSIAVTVAIAMTFAYAARFWCGVFVAGPASDVAGRARPRPAPALTWPIALLAAVIVALGCWLDPFESAFADAGREVVGHAVSLELAYHLDLRPETWMALGGWTAGALAFATRRRWEQPLARILSSVGRWIGPAAWADRIAAASARSSSTLHQLERRDLRNRLGPVVVFTQVLVLLAFAVQGRWPAVQSVEATDVPALAGLAAVVVAAAVASRAREHLSLVLLLSFVGYLLALVYALAGAAEVALVAVLVETMLTILFLAVLVRIPARTLSRAGRRGRDRGGAWIAVASGVTATAGAWFSLAYNENAGLASIYSGLADDAHAHDVVTAILADFRGFDTAVEVTVFVVAILGAVAITWSRSRD